MWSDMADTEEDAPEGASFAKASETRSGEHAIRTVAMKLSYLGGPFRGFARQPGLLTVQGEIEKALSILFRREVETVCAGRTDAGVHARGQVVSFELFENELAVRSLHSVMRSVNALVDDGIEARAITIAPDGFSARFDAMWREYRYRLNRGPCVPLFTRDLTWQIDGAEKLNLDAMRAAAELLVGEHDFKSFCVTASAIGRSTKREVFSIDIYEEDQLGEPATVVKVVGNAFLHSMVRTIVGTLSEVGCGRRDPAWVGEVIEARERSAAGATAPAKGLVLWHVEYGDRLRWEDGR